MRIDDPKAMDERFYESSRKFLQADQADAALTLRWLTGGDMTHQRKWTVKNKIPTAWYAAEVLAPANGITAGKRHAWQGMDGRWCAYVIAKKGHGKYARAQIGASVWEDRQIALCFAYRNGIRQLLPQAPTERLAYRDTQDNAVRKYA